MNEREGLEVKAGCVNEGERSGVKEEKSVYVGGKRDREQKREETQKKRKKEGREKKDRCNCYLRLGCLFSPPSS